LATLSATHQPYSINKKIPAKSQDFQEPKTKIYETFYLQPILMAAGLYDKNRCKNTYFCLIRNDFLEKNF